MSQSFHDSREERQLRQVLEVFVAGVEHEVVLDNQSGDQEVVGGNRRAVSTQLGEQMGIVVGGVVIGQEDPDSGTVQKMDQDLLVLAGDGPTQEAGAQLGQGYEGDVNFIRLREAFDSRRHP